MIAAMMVARNTPPHGMPVWLRIWGLTTMMYAMAKNVVRPARISVETVVPFSFKWKNFSIVLSSSCDSLDLSGQPARVRLLRLTPRTVPGRASP